MAENNPRRKVALIANLLLPDGNEQGVTSTKTYVEALEKYAGVDVEVIRPDDKRTAKEIKEQFDGFAFTGGPANVEAHRYGSVSLNELAYDEKRTEFSMALYKELLEVPEGEKKKPILPICLGMQELAVYLGGSLFQNVHEISGFNPGHAPDEKLTAEARYSLANGHALTIVPNSFFAQLAKGAAEVDVNSVHTQALMWLPKNLIVQAVSKGDGLIEGVRLKDHPFCVGIQAHPERLVGESTFAAALFRSFGDAVDGKLDLRALPGLEEKEEDIARLLSPNYQNVTPPEIEPLPRPVSEMWTPKQRAFCVQCADGRLHAHSLHHTAGDESRPYGALVPAPSNRVDLSSLWKYTKGGAIRVLRESRGPSGFFSGSWEYIRRNGLYEEAIVQEIASVREGELRPVVLTGHFECADITKAWEDSHKWIKDVPTARVGRLTKYEKTIKTVKDVLGEIEKDIHPKFRIGDRDRLEFIHKAVSLQSINHILSMPDARRAIQDGKVTLFSYIHDMRKQIYRNVPADAIIEYPDDQVMDVIEYQDGSTEKVPHGAALRGEDGLIIKPEPQGEGQGHVYRNVPRGIDIEDSLDVQIIGIIEHDEVPVRRQKVPFKAVVKTKDGKIIHPITKPERMLIYDHDKGGYVATNLRPADILKDPELMRRHAIARPISLKDYIARNIPVIRQRAYNYLPRDQKIPKDQRFDEGFHSNLSQSMIYGMNAGRFHWLADLLVTVSIIAFAVLVRSNVLKDKFQGWRPSGLLAKFIYWKPVRGLREKGLFGKNASRYLAAGLSFAAAAVGLTAILLTGGLGALTIPAMALCVMPILGGTSMLLRARSDDITHHQEPIHTLKELETALKNNGNGTEKRSTRIRGTLIGLGVGVCTFALPGILGWPGLLAVAVTLAGLWVISPDARDIPWIKRGYEALGTTRLGKQVRNFFRSKNSIYSKIRNHSRLGVYADPAAATNNQRIGTNIVTGLMSLVQAYYSGGRAEMFEQIRYMASRHFNTLGVTHQVRREDAEYQTERQTLRREVKAFWKRTEAARVQKEAGIGSDVHNTLAGALNGPEQAVTAEGITIARSPAPSVEPQPAPLVPAASSLPDSHTDDLVARLVQGLTAHADAAGRELGDRAAEAGTKPVAGRRPLVDRRASFGRHETADAT